VSSRKIPLKTAMMGRASHATMYFIAGAVTRVGFITISLTWFKRTTMRSVYGKEVISRTEWKTFLIKKEAVAKVMRRLSPFWTAPGPMFFVWIPFLGRKRY